MCENMRENNNDKDENTHTQRHKFNDGRCILLSLFLLDSKQCHEVRSQSKVQDSPVLLLGYLTKFNLRRG